MEEVQPGIYLSRDKLFTENARPGEKVYGEALVREDGVEYRRWVENRSKVGAAVKKGMDIGLRPDCNVLYLGAASGTTISHFSDILTEGVIVGVEYSDSVIRGLVELAEERDNIAPVLGNARNPEEYEEYLDKYDYVFQDISQRDQPEIFVKNVKKYLKDDGIGLLAVKARSISDSRPAEEIFEEVKEKVSEELSIVGEVDLAPFEKDHVVLKIRP